jgi:hypothetical protein
VQATFGSTQEHEGGMDHGYQLFYEKGPPAAASAAS